MNRLLQARRLRRLAAVALGAAFTLGLAVEIAIRLTPLPAGLAGPFAGTPVLMDVKGRVIAKLATAEARSCRPIPLAEMGVWLPKVTVALEDHRFWQHSGVDLRASLAACGRNARAGRIVAGGSTITQQLVKIASHRAGRSWGAKLYENLAALKIERTWSKERILEEYLNRSQFGNRIVGPAEAARLYFGKTAARLSLGEALFLAGLPQAPSRFNPWTRANAAAARFQRAAARYGELVTFDETDALQLLTPPPVQPRRDSRRLAPHFVELVREGSPRLRGVVATTLDLDLQAMVERAVARRLGRLAERGAAHAAVVVLDHDTGAVRALVGSRDFQGRDGQNNGAAIFRSCGSALKPFVYLQAIDQKLLTAATLLPDTPDAIRAEYIDYDPANYDHRFWGPVRVREALANSLNVPAVVTLSRVGARRAFRTLQEWGLRFGRDFDDYGAGMILGNAEVRLLDLTACYGAFARGGLAPEPRLLAGAPARHHALASPESVSIIADILSDNEARRKTFGAFSPLAFENQRVPAKTGTSSGFRDAWTLGLTGRHAVGVWVGNFNGRPMDEVAAVTAAAPLWREIVEALLPTDGDLAAPVAGENLVRREVCQLTGLRPAPSSPGTVREWFLAGTEPREGASTMLRETGGKAELVLPAEYALWCSSAFNQISARTDETATLRIVNPAPGGLFLFDPHLPARQQMLRLLAAGCDESEAHWRVNDAPVEMLGGLALWSLKRGTHRAAVESRGRRAEVTFRVE